LPIAASPPVASLAPAVTPWPIAAPAFFTPVAACAVFSSSFCTFTISAENSEFFSFSSTSSSSRR
jgi:hypothetical protein